MTTNGIELLLNYRPVKGTVPGAVVQPVDVLLIDGTGPDFPEEAMLGRPSDVMAGANGEIAVLDDHQVKVFDAEGHFVRSFGRRGSGPGEFEYPWRMPPLNRDQAAVQESMQARIVLYGLTGEYIDQFNLPFATIWGIAAAPNGGYFILDIQTEGNVTGGKRHYFIRRLDREWNPIAFETSAGKRDTVMIASVPYSREDQFIYKYTNSRPLMATSQGPVLAVGADYTFFRIDETGRLSAFRRVAEPARWPEWYLQQYRESFVKRGRKPPTRIGHKVEPNFLAVDERGHLWVVPTDGSHFEFVSNPEELERYHLISLDEFDTRGRWLRNVMVELPEKAGGMVLTDAAHGYLYGLLFPGPEMEASPVIRFRRPD